MARSRLGTSDGEKSLPPVPTIPNMAMSAAVPPSPTVTEGETGRGSPSKMGDVKSTTGLIAPGKR